MPEVQPSLDTHLADHDQLLLHVFVARVRDAAIDAFHGGETNVADRILAVFETGLCDGGEQVENAIAVSFVETLHGGTGSGGVHRHLAGWSPRRGRAAAQWGR